MKSANEKGRQPLPGTLKELELRAEALNGRTVGEVAERLGIDLPQDNKYGKGYVGLVAEYILGADPRAGENPDFTSLGVELKTLPLKADGRPAESTFCCAINMARADQEVWETSRLRQKLQKVLWLPVASAKETALAQRFFGKAFLWSPNAHWNASLEEDWTLLMGLIGSGMSDEISAHIGKYLQVRPKAAHSGVRTEGLGVDGPTSVLPLGFYLRPSFTEQILLEHIG